MQSQIQLGTRGQRRTNRNSRSLAIRVILIIFLAALGGLPAAGQISGSVKTTLPDGSDVNGNRYGSKSQVFFTAGPQNEKASGLPDGRYYFQVTDPSGAALLSNDAAVCRQVAVINGRVAGTYDPVTQTTEPAGTPLDTSHCEHASTIPAGNAGPVPVQAGGAFNSCPTRATGSDIFCDTPNPGGEYKFWLIAQKSAAAACNTVVNADGVSLTFDQKCAKTDNFKLAMPAVSTVVACKFNDSNGNGVRDSGELMISGWPITASVPAASYVTLRSDNQAGTSVTANTDSTGCVSFTASGITNNTQTVTLSEASQTGWTQTAPANGSYDASGKSAASGVISVAGAVPASGVPATGGIISVNLAPGATVTAPSFGNTDPHCPDCSVLGTITVFNTATPNKLYQWGVTKSVDKTEIDYAGPSGSATFNYTVAVTHDTGAGSLLSGTITLINGESQTPFVSLNITDAVSDGGVCKVKDPVSGNYLSEVFNLTLNAFTELSLPYQCSYASNLNPSAGTNTVSAALTSSPAVQFTSKTPYNFTGATTVDTSVTVTDTLKGTLGTVSFTDPSPKTFSYPYTFSTDPSGSCTSHNNTATVTANTTANTSTASQAVSVCVKSPVTITTTPTPSSATLGASPVTLKDTAVLAGGVNPTGSITFTLVYQSQTVYTETVPVTGNGTYTTLTGYALPTTGTVVGSYQWNASYSGDTHTNPASETNAVSEQVSLAMAAPSLQVQILVASNQQADGSYVVGSSTTSSATISGGYNPTGTLTFNLSIFSIDSVVVCTQTVAVNGNGTYPTPTGCVIPTFGSFMWNVTYSGDSNNASKTRGSSTLYAEY